ncbi:glycosyltransferase family 2 protein [Hydrogenovibrio sp. SC-1]|uniref:glycosyltransferase family 2 protein n=1 Tax=Hydrogenovibrio sp. SC-1 TaxID=2065820 RepID=UPI0013046DD4|nr:glycosyltransferase family 2 protein [Hydrogenovibrio sp. SC-1]
MSLQKLESSMKPEVSILMNCFNSETYLNEAIESVFQQTFTDWELIFVDNCSSDSSAQIASSFGEKVKVVRTEKNIPLGAARNFGISHCSGDYIAILDTDDIWFPSTLEKQLSEIKSGDYALVYGGQENINTSGITIGEMRPKQKSGFIFGSLLKQFDVPIVTTMLSKKHLSNSGLKFDPNVTASEEYCLFMQLAAKYKFSVIDDVLVKYRIHDNSLTNKSISRWGDERRYTLNKIISENSAIREEYSSEFDEAFSRAAYYDAQYFMSIQDKKSAERVLRPCAFKGYKYFLLFILLKFFPGVWNKMQRMKYGRNI